jgi:glutathione-independent formaldehyde dehydrogenase
LTNGIPVQEQIAMIVGIPEDCFVDCVGFEASGHGADAGKEKPAVVLNQAMAITRAGGSEFQGCT